MMQREWLESFYKECGREVSLAYNVLNQTNNWGVTLGVAVVATCFLGTARLEAGRLYLTYPTFLQWYLVIFAWIIMVRFFVRSALGLANMYRWNELIKSTCKVLSLQEGHPYLSALNSNLSKKIEAYFFCWKSPKKKRFIVWRNLKLMYFWFFLVLLFLFTWGIVNLEKSVLFWVGIIVFIVPTGIEMVWFIRWEGLKYQELTLETEPAINDILKTRQDIGTGVRSDTLILGFCEEGPFRHATSLLINPTVKWLPWSYQEYDLHDSVVTRLQNNANLQNQIVAFASWKRNFVGPTRILRYGHIDYIRFANGNLALTIQLDDIRRDESDQNVDIKDPSALCFFAQ